MFIKILLESAWLLVLWPSACFIYSNLWRFSSIPSSSIDERVVLARVCVRAKSVGQPFPPLDPTALGDQAAIFDPRSSLEYSDYKRGHVCGGQFKEGYRGKGTKSTTNEGPEIRAAASQPASINSYIRIKRTKTRNQKTSLQQLYLLFNDYRGIFSLCAVQQLYPSRHIFI